MRGTLFEIIDNSPGCWANGHAPPRDQKTRDRSGRGRLAMLDEQKGYDARQYSLFSAVMTTTPVSTFGGSGEMPAPCQSLTDLISPLRTA